MKPFELVTEEDLIALHMKELLPARAAEVRRGVQSDAALALESAALSTTLATLKGRPFTMEASLLNRNWEALRAGLVAHGRPVARVPRWQMPVFAGLVLAGAATVGYLVAGLSSAQKQAQRPVQPEAGVDHAAGLTAGALGSRRDSEAKGSLSANPGGHAGLTYRMGVTPRLGVGVFHPYAPRPGAVVRMLGLAQVQAPLSVEPRGPVFPEMQPRAADLPLSGAGKPAVLLAEVGPGPLTVAPAGGTEGSSQGSSGAVGKTAGGKKHRSRVETMLSLGGAGQLTLPRNADYNGFIRQSLDASPVVLGTVRQTFKPWLGYTAHFGYTRTTEQNQSGGPFYPYFPTANGVFPVAVNVYELSVAPTVRRKLTARMTGFANVGGGVLTFLPVHRGATAKDFTFNNASLVPSVLFRQLGVAAVGVDYKVTKHMGLRAEYRGMIYKYPDFGGRFGRGVTETSEPAVSVTYRFGGE